MSEPWCKIDSSAIDKMLAELAPEKREQVINTALRKGAGVLAEATRQQLQADGINVGNGDNKWGLRLLDGVRVRGESNTKIIVDIMGDFRLKFFENGTVMRELRGGIRKKYPRGTYRGLIHPSVFFQKARLKSQDEVISAITGVASEYIEKIKNQ